MSTSKEIEDILMDMLRKPNLWSVGTNQNDFIVISVYDKNLVIDTIQVTYVKNTTGWWIFQKTEEQVSYKVEGFRRYRGNLPAEAIPIVKELGKRKLERQHVSMVGALQRLKDKEK